MRFVQWAPSGSVMDGVPSEVMRLLADEDGKTYGYGWGPGTSVGFGYKGGDVYVNAGQYVIRHDDGRIEVSDTRPERYCPTCGMSDHDKGDDPEVMDRWESYHDAHCAGRWGEQA